MSNIEADSIKQQIKTAESIEEILEIVDKVLDVKNERIQELEEENKSKQKAYDDCYCEYKYYKQFDSIPKQKVKDILQNNRNELFSITYVEPIQYKPFEMQIERINKIEKELSEDK